ncbi:MAG: hypothetical protein RIQ89_905 [Bacteroidota bacterium]
MKIQLLVIVLSAVLMPCPALSQKSKTHILTTDEAKIVKKDGSALFTAGDYKGALKSYGDLVLADGNNPEYNYRLGYSMLMASGQKAKALELIRKAMANANAKKEWVYGLAQALQANLLFDDAIKEYEKFIVSGVKLSKDQVSAAQCITQCQSAREIIKDKKDLTFENPGKIINTPFEEYNAFTSADGKTIAYASRRKGNMGGYIEELGIYTADVYWTFFKDTAWSKSKSTGAGINTEWDEEITGLSSMGDQATLMFDNFEAFGDIGTSNLKGKTWQKYLILPSMINTKAIENGAAMSGNGTIMIFSRETKEGKLDLFYSTRQPGGIWKEAQKMPAPINTKEDEDAPWLSFDGNTLFYSSKGLGGFGGYDIFQSNYDEGTKTWSNPININFPINNFDDNLYISFTGNNRTAYVTQMREGGTGDKDIWRINFTAPVYQPFKSIVKGSVVMAAGSTGKPDLNAAFLLNENGKPVANFYPIANTTEFVLAAPAGNYILQLKGNNFNDYKTPITLNDEDIFKTFEVNMAK